MSEQKSDKNSTVYENGNYLVCRLPDETIQLEMKVRDISLFFPQETFNHFVRMFSKVNLALSGSHSELYEDDNFLVCRVSNEIIYLAMKVRGISITFSQDTFADFVRMLSKVNSPLSGDLTVL